MSEEKKLESAADVERAASQAARETKPKQKPVYVYLVAMFAVALLLMSLSFFMSHRSNQEVMGELQQNMNSFQLLQDAEQRNAELMEQVSDLEKELDEQRDTIYELQQQIDALQKELKETKAQLPAATEETPAE
mgnify:CR=1 FL=1